MLRQPSDWRRPALTGLDQLRQPSDRRRQRQWAEWSIPGSSSSNNSTVTPASSSIQGSSNGNAENSGGKKWVGSHHLHLRGKSRVGLHQPEVQEISRWLVAEDGGLWPSGYCMWGGGGGGGGGGERTCSPVSEGNVAR